MKILRHGKAGTHLTTEGSHKIVIMEKLDGANASFKLEDGQIKAFSRNNELNETNTLRGFYQWTQTLDPNLLTEGAIYFGEWLVKHKISYGDNENQFYLFDIYDEETERYIGFNLVKIQAEKLGINLVPVFYEGKFQSNAHLLSFVGQSKLGKYGEGVVVKNYDWTDKHGDQQFTKIVSDKFAEVQQVKKQRLAPDNDLLNEFVESNLTAARVDKILHKLVDENILEEDYDVTDMGVILKNAGSRLYEDIIEEELDELLQHVKKKIGKQLPTVIKGVLAEQGRI